MKLFDIGGELRLTKEDLIKLLQKSVDCQLTGTTTASIKVSNISLHPANKYVVRLILE